MHPTRLFVSAAIAASIMFAACGSDSGSTPSPAAAATDAVGVKHVDGLGDVLVDPVGKALYTPDQDTARKIRCTGKCTSFWQPLVAGRGKPTTKGGATALGVVRRPDGTRQVAADDRPLYTFSEDTASSITGDGFQDKFNGRTFLWHVVLAGGGPAPAPTADSGGSGGSGGYGY